MLAAIAALAFEFYRKLSQFGGTSESFLSHNFTFQHILDCFELAPPP